MFIFFSMECLLNTKQCILMFAKSTNAQFPSNVTSYSVIQLPAWSLTAFDHSLTCFNVYFLLLCGTQGIHKQVPLWLKGSEEIQLHIYTFYWLKRYHLSVQLLVVSRKRSVTFGIYYNFYYRFRTFLFCNDDNLRMAVKFCPCHLPQTANQAYSSFMSHH